MLKNSFVSLIQPGARYAPRASYHSRRGLRPATAPRALTYGAMLLGALMFAGLRPAAAAPYASNVTVVTDATTSVTTVSFVLNQTADLVEVRINGGAPVPLDGTTAGLKTFTLGAANDTFQIRVRDNDPTGYTVPTGTTVAVATNGLSQPTAGAGFNLLSTDSSPLNRFNSPRGVTVVTSPTAPNFGTAYISNSLAGNTTGVVRAVGDGLYALKPDQSDAFGYGNTANYGQLPLTPASANAPFRITAASNGDVYVADFSDGTGLVGRLNPNLTTSNLVLANVGGPFPLPAGQNHGSTTAIVPVLAGNALTLYTLDEDLTSSQFTPGASAADRNSLWKYDITDLSTPFAGAPTKVASVLLALASSDVDVAADGKFYVAQNRSGGTDGGGLIVLAPNGTTLFNSLTASRNLLGNATAADIFRNVQGVAVSPRQDFVALMLNNSDVAVMPLVNGIPDIARRAVVDTGPDIISGRDISFDAAGNIHYVSSGQGLYRILGPGGTTEFTTSSNGTTLAFAPLAAVTSISRASETPNQSNTLSFTVTFNQAVTGVDTGVGTGDFAIVTTGNLSGTITGVTPVEGSGGSTYTVTVGNISGTSGTIGLNLVDNDTILDVLGNPLGGAGVINGDFTGQFFTRNNVASTPGAIISEFRFRGPGGSADEYVEIYNPLATPLDINGLKIRINTGTASAPVFQDTPVPTGTASIPPRGHFLFTGTGFSLSTYSSFGSDATTNPAQPVAPLVADASPTSGVALLNASDAIVDAVGFASSEVSLREGAGLAAATPDGTAASQFAFMRDFVGQFPKDTGNNASDFVLVSTTGAGIAGDAGLISSQLGAPSPESLSSPTLANTLISVRLLDLSQNQNSAPNRVRTGTGNAGNLLVRRTLRNNSTQAISRLRMQVTRITGQNSPFITAGQADVRLIGQPTETGVPIGTGASATTVTVFGTALEAPSNTTTTSGSAPNTVVSSGGGGLGSSLSFDLVLATPLQPNDEKSYAFNLQVAQSGNFVVVFNILANTQPATPAN